jgi:hypothetical protein
VTAFVTRFRAAVPAEISAVSAVDADRDLSIPADLSIPKFLMRSDPA